MPWYQRDEYRFWVAEHKDEGVVIFHNPASFRHGRPAVVALYQVRTRCWEEFGRDAVKEDLITGRYFDSRNPDWFARFDDWNWFLVGVSNGTLEYQNPSPKSTAPLPPIPYDRESLIGWGSAGSTSDGSENESDDMKTRDWSSRFDDFDSGNWENYIGGPDE